MDDEYDCADLVRFFRLLSSSFEQKGSSIFCPPADLPNYTQEYKLQDFAALDALEAQHLAAKNQAPAAAGPTIPRQASSIWAQPPPAAGHTACPWPGVSVPAALVPNWPITLHRGSTASPAASGSQAPPQQRRGEQLRQQQSCVAALKQNTAWNQEPLAQQSRLAEDTAQAAEPNWVQHNDKQLLDDVFTEDFDWGAFDLHCEAARAGIEVAEPPGPARQEDGSGQAADDMGSDEAPETNDEGPVLVECRTANKGVMVHR